MIKDIVVGLAAFSLVFSPLSLNAASTNSQKGVVNPIEDKIVVERGCFWYMCGLPQCPCVNPETVDGNSL